jgi:hypothetical protein
MDEKLSVFGQKKSDLNLFLSEMFAVNFYLPGRGDCEASAKALAEARAKRNRGGTSVPPIERMPGWRNW